MVTKDRFQRARLWAHLRQPGPLAAKRPEGRWLSDAVLEVSDGVLDLGVAAMVGFQFQGLPLPVGDAAVIAKEGQLGTGQGCTRDDEPHRCGVGLTLEAVPDRRLRGEFHRAGRAVVPGYRHLDPWTR